MKGLYQSISGSWFKYLGGQFWVGWGWSYWGGSALVSFFREVCGLDLGDDMNARAKAYAGTCESACWWWPHKDFVMVCERPARIDRDARGRLHSLTRKAIEWPDGWGLYRVHGVAVPEDIVLHPESITVQRIDSEKNAEIRRVMIEQMGIGRYVSESKARVVHEDVDSLGLPRRLLWRDVPEHDPIVVVEVINSSTEPGTEKMQGYFWDAKKKRNRKVYHLAVHHQLRPLLDGDQLGEPQTLTCHNAVAASFGLRGEDYHPDAES